MKNKEKYNLTHLDFEVKKSEESAPEPKKIRRMSKRAMHRWIRFFSLASVVLAAVFTLAVIMAFNHYKTYPGVVERDSLSSPGRGSD